MSPSHPKNNHQYSRGLKLPEQLVKGWCNHNPAQPAVKKAFRPCGHLPQGSLAAEPCCLFCHFEFWKEKEHYLQKQAISMFTHQLQTSRHKKRIGRCEHIYRYRVHVHVCSIMSAHLTGMQPVPCAHLSRNGLHQATSSLQRYRAKISSVAEPAHTNRSLMTGPQKSCVGVLSR
jgi:hypothetical protein